MESILTSIKKLLGIAESYKNFDTDIIIHINSALMVLNQLGVGPSQGFSIKDETNTWSEFIPEDRYDMESIKSYVYMKVRLLFDPPASSAAITSMEKLVSELEFRINVAAETPQPTGEEEE